MNKLARQQEATLTERSFHGFGPVGDENSTVLILGSFPSVRSRADGFYYAHPRNRFWPLLARLLEEPLPQSIPEKKALLARHGIALWDVAESCLVIGSGDNTIREVAPVNIRELLELSPIRAVFCNGSTAWQLYMEYLYPVTQMEAVKLPSTSPANAAVGDEALFARWSRLLLPALSSGDGFSDPVFSEN